jgi:very-short-patch-repair endonuclease
MPTDLELYRAEMTGDSDQWERALETRLKQLGIAYIRQYKFALDWTPPRAWVADFAICEEGSGAVKFLVEVDGGTFKTGGGGHNRAVAYQKDRERDAEAMCHGLYTLRVVPKQIENDQAIGWIERMVGRM